MKRKYRVVLPIDIGGRVFHFGDVAEIDIETAIEYSHALIEIEEDGNGRSSERLPND